MIARHPILATLLAVILGIGLIALILVGRMAFGPQAMDFAGGRSVELAAYQAKSPTGLPDELRSADVVTRGAYLTKAADCQACHTVPGGVPFAGGRAFKLPFGTLFTPNITPDRETGIGAWTDAEFLKAVHEGVGRGGKRLYPAFPYASYTLLSDDDVLAIKRYLFSLKPVRQVAPPNTLSWPYNQRWLMRIWGGLFNPDHRFRPNLDRGPQWNRGAYLVEAAAHCGECHSPRNLLQALDNRRKFAGGTAEGWNAYNITSDPETGIGAWSQKDIADYLSAGHAEGKGTASGPMREAVDLSLRHLSRSDIAAIASYVASVSPIKSRELPAVLAGPAASSPREGPRDNPVGKRIFEGACASCHAWTGAGAIRNEAQLSGMRSVNDPSAANVARMILSGAGQPGGEGPYMPGFSASYSDDEIAMVTNYVVARFGDQSSRVTAKDIRRIRADQ